MDFLRIGRLLAIWLVLVVLTASAGCSTDRREHSPRHPDRYPSHDDDRYEERHEGGGYEGRRDIDHRKDRESHSGHDRAGHDER